MWICKELVWIFIHGDDIVEKLDQGVFYHRVGPQNTGEEVVSEDEVSIGKAREGGNLISDVGWILTQHAALFHTGIVGVPVRELVAEPAAGQGKIVLVLLSFGQSEPLIDQSVTEERHALGVIWDRVVGVIVDGEARDHVVGRDRISAVRSEHERIKVLFAGLDQFSVHAVVPFISSAAGLF